MKSTEIHTIKLCYFSDKYAREWRLRILGLRYTNEHLILNHALLIFKIYIYNARTACCLNISHLLIYIKSIKDTERKLCKKDSKGRRKIRNEKMF